MSKKPNRFGDAFKVKEEDVFSQLTGEMETKEITETRENKRVIVEDHLSTVKKEKLFASKTEFKRVSFYITPEQHREIKIMAAQGISSEDKDISAIVRNALTAYLKNKLI